MNSRIKDSLKIDILKDFPVCVHWSFVAGGLLVSLIYKFAFPETLYFCMAYTLLILLHEFSHALAARFFGLTVFGLEISGTGGFCWTHDPPTFMGAMALSCAGILAQLLLLIGTLFYIDIHGKPTSILGECLAITFIYVNSVLIVLNLFPRKRPSNHFGTDGYLLWKLIINRFKGKPYAFPDTSATFATDTRLTKLPGYTPPGFVTGIEILNDNDTTMEFVISALKTHLELSEEEATALMLDIHTKGGLLISVPTYEKAQRVATAITSDAKENGFSLICRPIKLDNG